MIIKGIQRTPETTKLNHVRFSFLRIYIVCLMSKEGIQYTSQRYNLVNRSISIFACLTKSIVFPVLLKMFNFLLQIYSTLGVLKALSILESIWGVWYLAADLLLHFFSWIFSYVSSFLYSFSSFPNWTPMVNVVEVMGLKNFFRISDWHC